jgi:TatD DNase family protein
VIELFDTHCHLQARTFDADRAEILARARAAGVTELVVIGESEGSSRAGIDLAAADPRIWAAVGLHPHNARTAEPDFDVRLAALAHRPRVVAIGEIGLDFHYDRSPRAVQADLFRRQLNVAAEAALPVVIHSREAESETLAILTEWSAGRRRTGAREPLGVMHCFGYGPETAARFIDLGFMISIPGTVTYPKADAVQAAARAVPDEWLVIETDAPVLAPQRHRGRRNEPAYLVETAEAVAALRRVDLLTLAARTRANAYRLFRLSQPRPADRRTEYVPA